MSSFSEIYPRYDEVIQYNITEINKTLKEERSQLTRCIVGVALIALVALGLTAASFSSLGWTPIVAIAAGVAVGAYKIELSTKIRGAWKMVGLARNALEILPLFREWIKDEKNQNLVVETAETDEKKEPKVWPSYDKKELIIPVAIFLAQHLQQKENKKLAVRWSIDSDEIPYVGCARSLRAMGLVQDPFAVVPVKRTRIHDTQD